MEMSESLNCSDHDVCGMTMSAVVSVPRPSQAVRGCLEDVEVYMCLEDDEVVDDDLSGHQLTQWCEKNNKPHLRRPHLLFYGQLSQPRK
jgi:hypothetical protein